MVLIPPTGNNDKHGKDGRDRPGRPKEESPNHPLAMGQPHKWNDEIKEKQEEKPDQPSLRSTLLRKMMFSAVHCNSPYSTRSTVPKFESRHSFGDFGQEKKIDFALEP